MVRDKVLTRTELMNIACRKAGQKSLLALHMEWERLEPAGQ